MRNVILIGVACLWAASASAQQVDRESCEKAADWLKVAAEARLTGKTQRETRKLLTEDMGRKQAREFVKGVYDLPELMLTQELLDQAKTQCRDLVVNQ